MVKNKDMQFLMENLIFENEKKKGEIFFDLLEQGFEPQIFRNFPAHDLKFHLKWGARDQMKTSF